MSEALVVQGRQLSGEDILNIRRLISDHPDWSRRRISEVLCAQWGWRNGSGRLKDMATRTLLLKLEARGWIELPPRRRRPSNRMSRRIGSWPKWDRTPVTGALQEVGPLRVREVSTDSSSRVRLAAALAEFHYLGCRGTVGENLQYMVTTESGRWLACLLFGAAAWKCKPRDGFIGWDPEQRRRNLPLVTNNTRFLILPYVKVPHLASWIWGQVLRRLSADWQSKYGHRILLVETFVDRERFRGTSYQAANWLRVGLTAGRSRQDRQHRLRVPIKEIYLYPLVRRFRQELSA
jgi:hypothetical protein